MIENLIERLTASIDNLAAVVATTNELLSGGQTSESIDNNPVAEVSVDAPAAEDDNYEEEENDDEAEFAAKVEKLRTTRFKYLLSNDHGAAIYRDMAYLNQRINNPILLAQGVYHSLEFVVCSFGSHPTAYVRIPGSWNPSKIEEWEGFVECHGGITYDGGVPVVLSASPDFMPLHLEATWIGWDYAHAGDRIGDGGGKEYTTHDMILECHEVIDQLIAKHRLGKI